MVRTVYLSPDNLYSYDLPINEITQVIQNGTGLVWVILEQGTEEEIAGLLKDVFHFHPLTIEDCLSQGYQTPKLDGFDNYLFLITHALLPDHGEIEELKYGGIGYIPREELRSLLDPRRKITDHR